jgi:glycerol dehydratase medium subunit/propanediol dehydratase medium subunit
MEYNEKLVQEITRIVVEKLKQSGINTLDASAAPSNKVVVDSDFAEVGTALKGINAKEVVVGIGPCFGKYINSTLTGIKHKEIIKEVMAGIEEEGMTPRVIRVIKTSDVAFIGKEAALLSGSGVSIGLQSKGTALIHQKDLYPLSNLELFPQAPLITLEMYRAIGKNAAKYAKGLMVKPIPVKSDFMSRPKYQVKAAIMHIKETENVVKNANSIEIKVKNLG